MDVEIGRGKKARQAYGFDDIAIVPSRRTRDPQDVDIGWKLGPHLLELPLLALGDGRRRLAGDRDRARQARRPRRSQPRGHLHALRESRRRARAHREAAEGPRDPRAPGDLPAAGRAEADRGADRGDQARRRARGRLAHAAEGARALRARAPGGARRARHPGHRRLGRARLLERAGAEPEGVHRRACRFRRSSAAAPRTRPRCT